jgi:multiple antibiotic resistance protein
MSSVVTLTLLTEVFVTLCVIMDPVGTIPIFLSLTRGRSRATVKRAAWQAVTVSFAVIVAFAFFGQRILDYPAYRCPLCSVPAGCCCSWSPWSCSPARRTPRPPAPT